MEEVIQFVQSVLNEKDSEDAVSALRTLGAESLTDLKLLDAEVELANVLPVLKRRRLSSAIRSQLIETGIFSCHIISCFESIE
jgi:hypothetical protein